ncbi:LapA family protein [Xylophilus sp. GW821-FHT01B05]
MIRTILLLVIALVIAALAALNWGTLAAPTAVSFGVAVVQAPLGLLMLGLTVLLAVFFVAYVVYLQGSVLVETRRHSKELQAQRELADKAEASRFTELRSFLDAKLQQSELDARLARDAFHERIAALEVSLTARAEQSDNSTAAHMGQLQDRLERKATPSFGVDPQVR